MKTVFPALLCIFSVGHIYAAAPPKLDPLPVPVSNNAVAISYASKEIKIYSLMGMGAKKTWDSITNRVFQLDLKTGKWTESRSVPGVAGRLGSSVAALREQLFLFGGFVVDGQGGETIVPDLNVFGPLENRWYRGEDIPVPVADAVLGVYRDRFIFLIGGRSKIDAVRDVQVYDTEKNKWMKATPIPGTPVFGHAGAIVGDTIIYVDGAYKNPSSSGPKYIASSECWMGKLTKTDVTKIEWTKLPDHPGSARFRIAAGPSEKEGRIYFSGGTDNPYNYDGIGYDGRPSEPSAVTFAFNTKTGKWETVNEDTPDSTMDHRGLIVTHLGLVIVGGMEKGQQVTAKVRVVKPASGK